MPYSAEISRQQPGCVLFLIDQSTSMNLPFGGSGDGVASRAQQLTGAINRLLQELVIRCTKSQEEGVRSYFDVGVFGYGSESFGPVFGGKLEGQTLVPIRDLAEHPLRLESVAHQVPDGAGGVIEVPVRYPVWFDLDALGQTPMCEALSAAHAILTPWVDMNARSFPPIVFNITDGEATDGDPRAAAEMLRGLATTDGSVLLFNVHLSEQTVAPLAFPSQTDGLPDNFAQQLYAMSSELPDSFRRRFAEEGYEVAHGARAFVFNAGIVDVIQCLDIGTRLKMRR